MKDKKQTRQHVELTKTDEEINEDAFSRVSSFKEGTRVLDGNSAPPMEGSSEFSEIRSQMVQMSKLLKETQKALRESKEEIRKLREEKE